MIEGLTVLNIKKSPLTSPSAMMPLAGHQFFELSTCQRTLYVGINHPIHTSLSPQCESYRGQKAYEYLLETILGLRSEVLAEYEVVHQFKEAYGVYLSTPHKNPYLMSILEKLFKDQKNIRSKHLQGIGIDSYASLCRRIILEKRKSGKIAILGSGQLALELAQLLHKKFSLTLFARNKEKALQIATKCNCEFQVFKPNDSYRDFDFVINTIGAKECIFNEDFFNQFFHESLEEKLFIDLSSPTIIQTERQKNQGVVRLCDLFSEAKKSEKQKIQKVNEAKSDIIKMAEQRFSQYTLNHPYGWEELQFV